MAARAVAGEAATAAKVAEKVAEREVARLAALEALGAGMAAEFVAVVLVADQLGWLVV